ncbi:MAG: hypothetical protein ABRQ26_04630 [Syntrophomonadaceae bacterium]
MIGRIDFNPMQYFGANATAVLYNRAAASAAGFETRSGTNLNQAIPSSASSLRSNSINSGPQKAGDKDCKT